MSDEHGTLVRWNDQRGFGFLQPDRGKREIFLHVRALPHYQRRPRVGDRLRFTIESDDVGQLFARSARIAGLALSPFTLAAIIATLLLVLYLALVAARMAPPHIGAWYMLMSLMAILAHSIDKGRAEKELWRIPESRLHLLEALGGWPGAFLAQLFYRHKIRKLSYQAVFWAIVAAHGGLWLLASSDAPQIAAWRRSLGEHADKIFISVRQTADNSLPAAITALLPGREQAPAASAGKASAPGLGRSTREAPPHAVITRGTVKEVRPELGLIVSLDKGLVGVVPRSTLVKTFPTAFTPGETIRFAIVNISLVDGQSRAEGVVVDR